MEFNLANIPEAFSVFLIVLGLFFVWLSEQSKKSDK